MPAVATVVIDGEEPVIEPVVAVTTCEVFAVDDVVKLTVAMPLAFVLVVELANDPPFVLDQVTVWPDVLIGLLYVSANCAEIVTAVPASGLVLLDVTKYFAGAAGTVVTVPLVPVRALPSVAVNVYVIPAAVFAVKSTVARPFAFVCVAPVSNDPPDPVLVHVTV